MSGVVLKPEGELGAEDEWATKTMTGAQLLALLQALTTEQLALGVFTEGCDCTGNAVALEIEPPASGVRKAVRRTPEEPWSTPGYLYIRRDN